MRAACCALVSGKVAGVLILEERDFPIAFDRVIEAAYENDAAVTDDGEDYFLVRLPGGQDRDISRAALRRSVDDLNREAVVGKANCGCVNHAEQGIPCVHDLALLP